MYKRQVIVNLITDALNQDKRILVVCQKRAALDVVYQRLDSLGLGSITSLIHDEKNDRTKLYQKLKTGLEATWREEEVSLLEYQRVSEKVANYEARLTAIAEALYLKMTKKVPNMSTSLFMSLKYNRIILN